ncbi:VanZ family protein [Candidatus Saccharibacteria bacterium]|nr:VanZ family protein [Candidatus Saccharibacteria bacterium]
MKKQAYKRVLWWGLFAIWLTLTVYLSSQNGVGSSSLSMRISKTLWNGIRSAFGIHFLPMHFITFHYLVRKAAHFTVHFLLAFFLVRASCWTFQSRKTAMIFAWSAAAVISMIDEALQLGAPGRFSAVFDAGLNVSGAVFGSFFSSLLGPKNLK